MLKTLIPLFDECKWKKFKIQYTLHAEAEFPSCVPSNKTIDTAVMAARHLTRYPHSLLNCNSS